jgi:predicted dehydrogenase
MNLPLGAALVGAGRIADLHILGYLNNPNARIVAICDRDWLKLKSLEKKIPYPVKCYVSIEKMLNDPDVDIVEILTPHSQHEKHTLMAIAACKHVSCQKPPTLTLSSFDRMARAAKAKGVKFRVYENFRFYPLYIKAKKIIERGEIGKVESVLYRMWASINPASSWDVSVLTMGWRILDSENYGCPFIFDDGYHKHSIISMFLGDFSHKIESVRTWSPMARVKGMLRMDSPASIVYQSGDKLATVNISLTDNLKIKSNYYGCDESLEIQGDKGVIFVNGCTGRMFEDSPTLRQGISWLDKKGEWHYHNEYSDWKYSFINCTNHFIDAVKNDRNDAQLSPLLARYILQVSLAAVKSCLSKGQVVRLSDITEGI